MGVVDVLMVLGVVLAIAGVAAFAMLWSGRATTRQNEGTRAFNALLQRVAASRSLSYEEPPVYEHPMMGSIPSYGTLGGRIGDLELSLTVKYTGGTGGSQRRDHIIVLLDARNENAWPAMKRGFLSGPTGAGPAFAALNQLSVAIEVGAGRLSARPHCASNVSSLSIATEQQLFKRDEELLHFLDLAVRTCAELRAR